MVAPSLQLVAGDVIKFVALAVRASASGLAASKQARRLGLPPAAVPIVGGAALALAARALR